MYNTGMMKEKTKTYTSYWKHKRPYGKRVISKINRRKAKLALDKRR